MDIKKVILISISSLLFFLTSCTQSQKKQVLPKKAKAEVNKKEVFTNFDLSNKLYLLAPEFNSKECEAYGECDCCSSNYLFLDNENFVCVDYCLESDTFYSGKYKIENEKVELKYNSTIVQKEYNWESETDTTNTQPKYFYKTEKCKSFQSVWIRFNCKEKICFKNINNETEYASLDKTKTSESFMTELKRDGIWQRLNIK